MYKRREVSNFGDGDCGADEIHTSAQFNFEETGLSPRVSLALKSAYKVNQYPAVKHRRYVGIHQSHQLRSQGFLRAFSLRGYCRM